MSDLSQISRQSFGEGGAIIATSGAGRIIDDFVAIHFIEETSLSELEFKSRDSRGLRGEEVTWPAGFILYAQITSFQITSGSAVLYKPSN